MPFSDQYKLTNAFFRSIGKVNTEANQNTFESIYKDSDTVKNVDIWADPIDYCVDQASADAWVTANPTIGHKYDAQNLTEVSGSNGQAWYINDGGTFIKNLIADVDVPHGTSLEPSYGFLPYLYRNDGVTRIMPTEGNWVVNCHAGIVKFQAGYTPADMGYALPIKLTCYNYVGTLGISGGSGSSAIRHTTTDDSLSASDRTLICDTVLNDLLQVELPLASSVYSGGDGQIFTIKNMGHGTVDIIPEPVMPSGTETIDDLEGTRTILNQGESVTIQSDGTGWYIL